MKRFWPACLLTAAIAVPAVAQETEVEVDVDRDNEIYVDDNLRDAFGPTAGDWELMIAGSGSNDNDFDNGSGALAFELGYFLTDGLAVSVRQTAGFASLGSDDSWTGSTTGALDYYFDLGRWRPFVGVSLGYLYGDDVNESFVAGPEVGVRYYVLEDTFINVRGGYEFTFEDADDADEAFDDGRFVYSLAIGFHF